MSLYNQTGRDSPIEELLPDIRRAARYTELEWPDVVQADDIEQSIVVRLLEDGYADQTLALDPPARRRLLQRIGRQLASGERVSYEYFSGSYRYSSGEVRSHLEKGALEEVGPEELGNGSETFSVEQVDIRRAYDSLPADKRRILFERFVLGEISPTRIYVTRAVDALARELNRAHRRAHDAYDGPGCRSAISNSAAHALSSRQEDYA